MSAEFEILLSPPHLGVEESTLIQEALASNWIAPLGPQVELFEREFAATIGVESALATSSGTAALHLALQLVGVERGDEVWVSTLTFVASANPVLYLGARPAFVDSDRSSWTMDPELLRESLWNRRRRGAPLPKALVLVHLYGQSADLDRIAAICEEFGVILVEDAAEALGATYRDRQPGSVGKAAIFSFNGNKIVTTSGGGMLVSNDPDLIARGRKLSAQAREQAPHYEHREVGYNYRLSNVLGALGRGQLRTLSTRVAARRGHFATYEQALSELPGVGFMPEAPWGRSTRWLSVITIDPQQAGVDRERVRRALAAVGIETRPVWKPMHRQPLFAGCESFGGAVSEGLFSEGLCLPSGSGLSPANRDRVIDEIRTVFQRVGAVA